MPTRLTRKEEMLTLTPHYGYRHIEALFRILIVIAPHYLVCDVNTLPTQVADNICRTLPYGGKDRIV